MELKIKHSPDFGIRLLTYKDLREKMKEKEEGKKIDLL